MKYKNLLISYISLERDILNLMSKICKRHCSNCLFNCCSRKLCLEVLKSRWNKNIIRISKGMNSEEEIVNLINANANINFSNGCPFDVGRPSICVQYFCDELLEKQSSSLEKYLIVQLGDIIPYFLNLKVTKKRINNLDLLNDNFSFIDKNYESISQYLRISKKKFQIINHYLLGINKECLPLSFFEDILFLEKYSGSNVFVSLTITDNKFINF